MRAAFAALGVLAAACATPGQMLAQHPQDATVSIRVSDEGLCWRGSIGGATQQGCGDGSVRVHDQLGMFSSNVQKMTDQAGTVTINIVVGGKIVASNSTSAAYGMAQVIAPLR